MFKPLRFFAAVCVLLMVVFATTGSYAQSMTKTSTKSVTLKGKTMAASRGANPHIKKEAPTTDVPKAASRGDAICGIYFDNYTGLTIKLYVDGDYYGTVGPYGNSTVVVGNGYTSIYCISAGGTREWSADGDCRDVYRYRLD